MTWLRYLLQRLFTTIAVLLGIVLLTYSLSRLADADPVYSYLESRGDLAGRASSLNDEKAYREAAHSLGLDLPAFFFTMQPSRYPDTLYKLLPLAKRQQAYSWLKEGRHADVVLELQEKIWRTDASPKDIQQRNKLESRFLDPTYQLYFLQYTDFASNSSIPSVTWHGWNNGFTHFAGNLLRGDLGYSIQSGNAVGASISRAFWVTAPIAFLALLLAILLSLLLGVSIAQHRAGWLRGLLYVLVSMPGFWLATVFITQLAGRGKPFPGPGWRDATQSIGSWLHHVTLPVLILAIPAAAYLALILEEALLRDDRLAIRDFARLQGASEHKVWWSEMLPLGIVPSLSTAVGLLIPSFIGGSVILEYVFNIPGLGRLVFESILSRDWPLVLGVVLVSGLATISGYLVMDLVNAWIDPRFRKFVTHAT